MNSKKVKALGHAVIVRVEMNIGDVVCRVSEIINCLRDDCRGETTKISSKETRACGSVTVTIDQGIIVISPINDSRTQITLNLAYKDCGRIESKIEALFS